MAESSIIYLVQTTPEWSTLKTNLSLAVLQERERILTGKGPNLEFELESLEAFKEALELSGSLVELSGKLVFGTLQEIPGGMWVVRASRYASRWYNPDPAGYILTETLRGHEITRVYH